MKAPWHHLCERIKDLKKKEQEVTACCSFCTSKFNTHVLKSKNSRETSSSPWTDESGRQQTPCVTNLPKRGSTGKEEGATFAEKAWREGRGHILRRCVSVVGQLSRTGSCWEVGPLGGEREIWFSGVSSCRDTSHRESGPILMTSRDLISKMQPHWELELQYMSLKWGTQSVHHNIPEGITRHHDIFMIVPK